jgi:hypothetical protein
MGYLGIGMSKSTLGNIYSLETPIETENFEYKLKFCKILAQNAKSAK